MHRKAIVLLISVTILVMGVSIGFLLRQPHGEEPGGKDAFRGGFPLVAPAFAQGTPASQFPKNEAAISCYANAGQPIDMAKARTAFRVIEEANNEYVIGTVELVGHNEDMWPHAWVSKDGWILVYYPKSEPTSKLVQWNGYQRDVITTTTLRDTLIFLGRTLVLDLSKVEQDLHYYHFQYPDAAKLLIVVDTAEGKDDFRYTIPAALTIYDASWSYGCQNSGGGGYGPWSVLQVDGTELYKGGGGPSVSCETLEGRYLTPGTAHTVSVDMGQRGWVGVAIVFIYR